MKKVYVDRLNKLADFMETVPRNRFDIKSWVGTDWKGKEDLSCGTAACMLGWATTIKSFRKLGLRLTRNTVYRAHIGLKNQPGSDPDDVAIEIFGVALGDLFFPYSSYDSPSVKEKMIANGDLTPKEAAARIRRYLKAHAND